MIKLEKLFLNLVLMVILTITTFLLFAPSAFTQSIPPYIYYQGRLVDQVTNVPVNQIKSITFSLYNTDTGGTPIYQQTRDINIVNGTFSVYLGKGQGYYAGNPVTDGIPSGVFIEHSARYLGIRIADSQTEMFPRQLITSAAYAYKAERAREAESIMGRVTVSPSGNVGIGTLSPISPLHINGDGGEKGLFLEEANVVFSKPRDTTDSPNLSLFRDYNEWAKPHGVLHLRSEGENSSSGSTIFSIDSPFSNPNEATLGLVLSDGIWSEIVDLYNIRGTSSHWGFNYIKDGSEARFRPFAISFQDGFGGPGTKVLEISPNGNVGIGTTNPGARLEIQGPGDNLNVGNALVVKASGNVGIGTTNPTEKLQVQGDITVNGTVDGRDISVDGTKLDELFQPWQKKRYEFTDLLSKQLVQWGASQNLIFVRVTPPSGGSCTSMMTANGGSGVGYDIGWTSVGQCTSGNSITITSNGTGHPQFTLSVDPGGGRLYITPVSGAWTGTTYVDVLTVYW